MLSTVDDSDAAVVLPIGEDDLRRVHREVSRFRLRYKFAIDQVANEDRNPP